MKLTTDNGRLLIEPDGNDSPVVNDMHVLQGWVLVMDRTPPWSKYRKPATRFTRANTRRSI
ncbi:MAG: hypothetical protein DME23_06910 [Verrucomicrobia bacterium]|nr:MAG: hypothetical protein DME23_06910 [Verrucomicrobiota bacterium]